jgi:hypothetical protein
VCLLSSPLQMNSLRIPRWPLQTTDLVTPLHGTLTRIRNTGGRRRTGVVNPICVWQSRGQGFKSPQLHFRSCPVPGVFVISAGEDPDPESTQQPRNQSSSLWASVHDGHCGFRATVAPVRGSTSDRALCGRTRWIRLRYVRELSGAGFKLAMAIRFRLGRVTLDPTTSRSGVQATAPL